MDTLMEEQTTDELASPQNTSKPQQAGQVTCAMPWIEFQHRANFGLALSLPKLDQVMCVGAPRVDALQMLGVPLRSPNAMVYQNRSLLVAGGAELIRFADVVAPGRFENLEYDLCLAPNKVWFVADIGVCDVGYLPKQRPLFVSSKFSCLGTVDAYNSFAPIWKPSFIEQLAPTNQCGLSGVAMQGTQATHVTAFGNNSMPLGWQGKHEGVLIDTATQEVICAGLSRPLAPRWHRGNLYMVDAGTGYFGRVDLITGKFEHIALCPGYVESVSFITDYAVVTVSLPEEHTQALAGCDLAENCKDEGLDMQCGVIAINLKTGEKVQGPSFDASIGRISGAAVLAQRRNPLIVSIASPDVKTLITGGPFQFGLV